MADFTPNYNLKKPLRTEYYNVADANGNSDIVDTQLKSVNDRVGLVEGEVDALELGKVDKVVGKQLSDENYTLIEKNKLAGVEENATADMTALEIKTEYESNADTNAYTDAERAKVANLPADTNAQLDGKVDKVTGKGLSTNDFDNTYKQKMDVDIPAQLADIENIQLPAKANKIQEDWITPTLLNGWVNFGAVEDAKYYKNTLGTVEIKGLIKNGSNNTIFILPAGYRPLKTIYITCDANNLHGAFTIQSNGEVKHRTGSNVYFSLVCQFRAEV